MAIAGVDISHELSNIPIGDMISSMAKGIADAQWELDQHSMMVAELMSGQRVLRDLKTGELITHDGVASKDPAKVPAIVDSRVYFGFDYTEEAGVPMRVPKKVSMMELGFTPTFYQFVDTVLEVKIDINLTGGTSNTLENKGKVKDTTTTRTDTTTTRRARFLFWSGSVTSHSSRTDTQVKATPIDAAQSSKYGYSAEGSSLLRTKIVPVPPPTLLEERIRLIEEQEEAWRARLKSYEGTWEENLGGLWFNGTDTHVRLPSFKDHGLTTGQSWTVEAMVKVDAYGSSDEAILGHNGPHIAYSSLHLVVRGRQPYMGFWLRDVAGRAQIMEGIWFHLAFVYDADAKKQIIYVNGNKDTEIGGREPLTDAAMKQPLLLGRWDKVHFFHGFIDDVRIWKGKRSPQQLKDNKKFLTDVGDLAARYRLNEAPSGAPRSIRKVAPGSAEGAGEVVGQVLWPSEGS